VRRIQGERRASGEFVHVELTLGVVKYELVEVARGHGFTNVEVIDDDLGRTACGSMERPGFDRLVAALCAGQIGAVLCLDASQLARNGRDWRAPCKGGAFQWVQAPPGKPLVVSIETCPSHARIVLMSTPARSR
jgi:hypothetical protein